MARLNIEEKWFGGVDPRRQKFIEAIGGDEFKADGAALKFWRLGQESHAKGKLVNKKAFLMLKYSKEFLACELAEEREGGIYIKGSNRQFGWLIKAAEARQRGGKKSAQRERDAMGRLKPKRKGSESSPSKTQVATNCDPAQPASLALSLAPSLSHTQTKLNKEADIAADAAHPPSVGATHPLLLLWNAHRGALPEARSCIGRRLEKAKQRWKEQTPDQWEATIRRMASSNFCVGKNNSGWRADFDFLLKPETWAKVNDGKYDNNRGAVHTAKTRTYDKLDELEEKWQTKGQ